MAHTTTNTHTTMTFPWMATIGRYFAAIGKGLVFMGESSSRFRKLEKLQALSDAELAKRGMKREDIVRVVFADSFWM